MSKVAFLVVPLSALLGLSSLTADARYGGGYRSTYRAPPVQRSRPMAAPKAPRQLAPKPSYPKPTPPRSSSKSPVTSKTAPGQANGHVDNRKSLGAAASPGGPKSPKNFVKPTNSPSKPSIPPGYVAEPSRDGSGTIYRAPGTTGNANTVRIMPPSKDYPNGRHVTYNKYGQPIDPSTGKPGGPAQTHVEMPSERK